MLSAQLDNNEEEEEEEGVLRTCMDNFMDCFNVILSLQTGKIGFKRIEFKFNCSTLIQH